MISLVARGEGQRTVPKAPSFAVAKQNRKFSARRIVRVDSWCLLNAAAEKKALDLTILDLREIASFTDFFVIATGTNRRQVQAISDEVVEQLKRNGTRAARVEGYQTAEWILVDYGDFVVHVFDDKARRFYDLERLWREARRVDVSPGSEISSVKSEISDKPERDVPRSLTDL